MSTRKENKKKQTDRMFATPQEEIEYLRRVVAGLRGENSKLRKTQSMVATDIAELNALRKKVADLDKFIHRQKEYIEHKSAELIDTKTECERLTNLVEAFQEKAKEKTSWWKRIFASD